MVRYLSSRRLSFPVSDSERNESGEVVLNFMGLTGVDSPLPYYIKFSLLLKMLNHKIYQLFFEAVHKIHQAEKYSAYIKNSFGETRANLEKKLKKQFKGVKIIMDENIPHWIKISTPENKIGQWILGERVCVSGFKIHIPRCANPVVIGQWIMR